MKIRNDAQKIHVLKFAAKFRFFERFRLIGGPKKKYRAPI